MRFLLTPAFGSAAFAASVTAMPASGEPRSLAAPPRPSGLVIGSVSKTSVSVSWDGSRSTAHVVGYRIYVDEAFRASVRSTSYLVEGLACGKSYSLTVSAFDARGHRSSPSSRVAKTLRCESGRSSATTQPATTSPATRNAIGACTATISSGLAAAIRRASAGATICLASGSYGDLSLRSVEKAVDVTVKPTPGADVAIGRLTFDMVARVRLSGIDGSMRIGGLDLDATEGNPRWSQHLTFDHVAWTGASNVRARGTDQAIVFDRDVFDNLGPGLWEGRISVRGYKRPQPVGVTISNSRFTGQGAGGNCSDGIQLVDANGVHIGPGNEFTGIDQSVCTNGAHADPIQCVGATNTVITGSYFHDNDGSGGVLCGFDDGGTVTNNVFVRVPNGYPYSVYVGGGDNWTVVHNTFAGGGAVWFGVFTCCGTSYTPSGNLVRDNVFTTGGGITTDGSNYGTNDHNLYPGPVRPGDGDRRGVPIFVGGRHPKTYADYRLTARSPGKRAASDGTDMGIR